MSSSRSTSSYSFMSDDGIHNPNRHRQSFFFETQVNLDDSDHVNNNDNLEKNGHIYQSNITQGSHLNGALTNSTNNNNGISQFDHISPEDEDSEKEIRESFRNSAFFAVYLDPNNFDDVNTSSSISELTNDTPTTQISHGTNETNFPKRSDTKNSQSTAPSSGRIKLRNTTKIIPPNPVVDNIRQDFTPTSNRTNSTEFFETSENIYEDSNNYADDDIHDSISLQDILASNNLNDSDDINGSFDSTDSMSTQDTNILNPQQAKRTSRETKTISTVILTNPNFTNFNRIIKGDSNDLTINHNDIEHNNYNNSNNINLRNISMNDNHYNNSQLRPPNNDNYQINNSDMNNNLPITPENNYNETNIRSHNNNDFHGSLRSNNSQNNQNNQHNQHNHSIPNLGPIPNVNTSLSSNEYSRGYQYDVSSSSKSYNTDISNFHGYDDTIEPNIEKAVKLLKEDITTPDNQGTNNFANDNIHGGKIARHELSIPFEPNNRQINNFNITNTNNTSSDKSNEYSNKPNSYDLHELKIPRRLSSSTNPSSSQNSPHLPRSPSLINRFLVTPSPQKVNRNKTKMSRPISLDTQAHSSHSNDILSPNSKDIPRSSSMKSTIPKVHVFQTVTGSNRWRPNPGTEVQQLTLGSDAFATPRKKLPNKWKTSSLHLKRLSFREEEEYGLDDIDEQESKKFNTISNNNRTITNNSTTTNSVSTNRHKFDDIEIISSNQRKSYSSDRRKSYSVEKRKSHSTEQRKSINNSIYIINSHDTNNQLDNPYEDYNPYKDQTPFEMKNIKYLSSNNALGDDNFKMEMEQRLMNIHDQMLNDESAHRDDSNDTGFTQQVLDNIQDTHINVDKNFNGKNDKDNGENDDLEYSFEMSRHNTVRKEKISKPNVTAKGKIKNPPYYMRANTTTPMSPAELTQDISTRYVQHIDTPSIQSFDSTEYKFFEVYSLKKLLILYTIGILIPPVSFIIGCGSSNSDGNGQGGGGIINDLKLMQMVINKEHRIGLLRGFIWDLDLNWLRRSMLILGIIEMLIIFAGVSAGMAVGLTIGQ